MPVEALLGFLGFVGLFLLFVVIPSRMQSAAQKSLDLRKEDQADPPYVGG